MKEKKRCAWCLGDEDYIRYHDEEWGVPVHDDRTLFEMLTLEGAQAGLSWLTVLKRREGYRKAFDHFDAKKIMCFDERKVKALLADSGIIRNRLKVAAAIGNAKAFLEAQKDFGSFDRFIWQFVGGKPLLAERKKVACEPVARTEVSDVMSRELKRRGFKFVGTTICYAFMQAVGMVNDHVPECFRAPKGAG